MTRILTGTLAPNAELLNPATETVERAGQILLPLGKETSISKEPLGPGSIVALAKLKDTATGHTLCDAKKPATIAAPVLPPPMKAAGNAQRPGASGLTEIRVFCTFL